MDNGEGSGIREVFRRLSALLQNALFPPKCRNCGTLFQPGERPRALSFGDAMAPFLCPVCREGFAEAASPLCPVCGEIFPSREGGDHLCGRCLEKPRPFGKARALGLYDRGLLAAIYCLKYKGRTELALPLGRLLLEDFRKHFGKEGIDLVVPVPLHPARMRKRGFNQSFQLIRHWPKWLGAEGTMEISDRVLIRTRETPSQTGLDRKERLKNLKDAFGVKNPDRIRGRRILLVDDVYTTGATAEACAKALLAAGADRVDVLTLARTVEK